MTLGQHCWQYEHIRAESTELSHNKGIFILASCFDHSKSRALRKSAQFGNLPVHTFEQVHFMGLCSLVYM